ncbi:unnamed protein product [Alopecurus aequalis]
MATPGAAPRRARMARDLAEEGKKRAVLLLVFAFGLAFLMSLTSSSVWINFPFSIALIVLFRYLSLDYDFRRKGTTTTEHDVSRPLAKTKSTELSKPFIAQKNGNSGWRSKVNSPPVEAAFDQFTRHLITEWVTDLWYSRVTPDKDGPEELVSIVNSVLGEISNRARNINLITLLTRDLVDLICNNLELYQCCEAKIGKEKFVILPTERRDAELKLALIAQNKLHPALFSASAEYKVLQSLADGLISITVNPENLKCSFFHCTARELLACAVLRPVINLANPRFINERIESLVISRANKADKGVAGSSEDVVMKQREPPMPSVDELSALADHSSPGVELVRFSQGQSKTASDMQLSKTKSASSVKPKSPNACMINDSHPLESGSLPSNSHIYPDTGISGITTESFKGQSAQILDVSSHRKNRAVAPEHLENMWTKGKNYKLENANHATKAPVRSSLVTTSSMQESAPFSTSIRHHPTAPHMQTASSNSEEHHSIKLSATPAYSNGTNDPPKSLAAEMTDHASHEDFGVDSESSYCTEDENNNVTGLDSPVTRVWDSKSKGNGISSHIHHPLESSNFHKARTNRSHVGKLKMARSSSGRKRSRSNAQRPPLWQEAERSFLAGGNFGILNTSANDSRVDGLYDDTEVESMTRMLSGANASSLSMASSDSSYSSNYSSTNVLEDSYLKLRCEVVGASIVKSGSGMFAVYSVSVTDANGNSWSIKRRFRHFEELHRRLKEYPQYSLHLPPKHFLSSGLEVPVVRERCKLLDIYLKNLLQIPTVSSCIEVWDFLSVDSQTYIFTDSLSVIQALSDVRSNEKGAKPLNSPKALNGNLSTTRQSVSGYQNDNLQKDKDVAAADGLRLRKGHTDQNLETSVSNASANTYQDHSGSDPEQNDYSFSINSGDHKKMLASQTDYTSQILESDGYSVTPNEWMAPNVSPPIFHLVDVIFQLQDGGWIRRQAFWVAKQILQLGMGDTFDDWLVEKIQLLRKGRIIAFAVKRVEQILWPDGIFMTKHPSRKPAEPSPGAQNDAKTNNNLTEEQRLEAARRADFVRELIIDKAPSALVSLVGRKEYERCAQDIYFFLQSQVCLKQLTFELLELLVLAAFPELDDTVRKWHEDKHHMAALE